MTGGVIDLSGNTDPRAAELERRIVLSQYLMAVHDSGPLPPQETGLGVNSWFGKFHMEMYWWHAAHWALWGHPEVLERSLDSLNRMMPPGEAMAKLEGAKGVKWSKMTDPSGIESPSGVGPVLVWQQPHPIYLAELVYRARKAQDERAHKDQSAHATLLRYKNIVFATADYMATFVDYDPARKEVRPRPRPQLRRREAHRSGPQPEPHHGGRPTGSGRSIPRSSGAFASASRPTLDWQDVIDHIAPPTVRNGIYPAMETPVETTPSGMTTFMYGVLPGRGIDKEAMRNTLHRSRPHRRPRRDAVTWGTAMMAMCAARLDEPDLAVQPPRRPLRPEPIPSIRLHRSPPRPDADVHARQRGLALRRRHDGRRLGRRRGQERQAHPRPRLPQLLARPLRRPATPAVAGCPIHRASFARWVGYRQLHSRLRLASLYLISSTPHASIPTPNRCCRKV